ncbi:MFS transporter [Microlunatus soli]|uniref:Sugar phosphate permease n=1 Tax=Microlunatus soli TaxID=630515 RepID=A0A1H1VJG3_9ACTN|nr:MFS transporter [Microlunatus soli]SDS84865.1 Sugar phosphate permease [Microlunatus soli]
MDGSTTPAGTGRRTGLGRRWTRLIPVILTIYIIAYIDRVNIGFALPSLTTDLQLTGGQAGFAAGIFFIGYLFLQVPGGWLAQRWSAKRLVIILLICWGLLATATGFVQNYGQLLAIRFGLGVVEGAVQPAMMVLISRWFPAAERGRAFSLFIMHNPIAVIIAGPLSGLILTTGGWREMFWIEGIAGLLIGVTLWAWIAADSPDSARWLPAVERAEIAAQRAADPPPPTQSSGGLALRTPIVWRLAAGSLLLWLGFYGLQLWLPTLLKQTFTGDLTIGLVSALPPIAAAIAIWFNGRGADRDRRHALRVMVPLALGGIVLAASPLITGEQPVLIVLALCVATACQLSFFGPFWSLAAQRVPAAAIGVGFGMINGIGNLGGALGPYLGGALKDRTGSLAISAVAFGLAVIIAGVIVGTIGRPRAPEVEPASADIR